MKSRRRNHYDNAFRTQLELKGTGYAAIDESRRAKLHDARLKSMDYVVQSHGWTLLIDVKGRRGNDRQLDHSAENWTEREEIESMLRWQQVFGARTLSVLVFVYHRAGFECDLETTNRVMTDAPLPSAETCRLESELEDHYRFFAITVGAYSRAMRLRSPRWDTVSIPRQRFRELRQPLGQFLGRPIS